MKILEQIYHATPAQIAGWSMFVSCVLVAAAWFAANLPNNKDDDDDAGVSR